MRGDFKINSFAIGRDASGLPARGLAERRGQLGSGLPWMQVVSVTVRGPYSPT